MYIMSHIVICRIYAFDMFIINYANKIVKRCRMILTKQFNLANELKLHIISTYAVMVIV